jgi:ParB family chromosome partitioning protein
MTPNENRELRMVPIGRIEVLNPRERNETLFSEMVENIGKIGLKKPITVTPRRSDDGAERYLLVCGEGRLRAFRKLGEERIPALIVHVSDDDAFLMGLVENIARRRYQPLELVAGLTRLQVAGYSQRQIAEKTGLCVEYIHDVLLLIERGEGRLLQAVKSGNIPMRAALNIVSAGVDDKAVQTVLQDAYEAGQLKGKDLLAARRMIYKRQLFRRSIEKGSSERKTSEITPSGLIRAYQKEIQRQRIMVRRASLSQQRLLFVVSALRKLSADENFCNLLRAEGLDTVPKYLAERMIKGA